MEVAAGETRGLGFTYADAATARFVDETLGRAVCGLDPMAIPAALGGDGPGDPKPWTAGGRFDGHRRRRRALWDLKSRLLDLPLVTLLGAARSSVPVYGSGGFTSYPDDRLCAQLAGWAEQGLTRVKMKVGRDAVSDRACVRLARAADGHDVALFVDANGAYGRKEALAQAEDFAASGVAGFEEPVSSDDPDGLRLLRERGPASIDIAAGEYGYDLPYFRQMLDAAPSTSFRRMRRAAQVSQAFSA